MEILRTYIFRGIALLLFLPSCSELDVTGTFDSYADVEQRFSQSLTWNTTHDPNLASASESYLVLFAGDVHAGGTANLEKLMGIYHDSAAQMLIIAGDVTTGNREDYENAAAVISSDTSVNFRLVAGNHDTYFEGWDSFYEFFGSSTYSVEVQNPGGTSDLFIFLDTASGTLGRSQLGWLESVLKGRKSYRHAVVCTHLNFFRNRFTTSTNPLNLEILTLLDLFGRYDVNLVVMGHDHLRYEEHFGDCNYITLDALTDDFNEASYLMVSVEEEGISYRFEDI